VSKRLSKIFARHTLEIPPDEPREAISLTAPAALLYNYFGNG
jgi:hypothetical protein